MAIKKSELYSSLWKSCDELRGGMDASQYKDYVLVLLFVKYVSDKYAGKKNALIEVPDGGSFKDLINLKGKPEIGEGINKIIAKLAEANELKGVIDVADFDDPDKLGKGKDMQDRLSNLIAIFENSALDFSKNRAEGDDILGDAYEYLMKHFATESGKSKGQFYTPSEVSRIMAKVIAINKAKSQDWTVYDPTCGSGSLLLKAASETEQGITIYGQEKELFNRGLAVMNMILHNNPSAEIWQDNTLTSPHFRNEDGTLKTFDFVIANPPFSDKKWSNGLDPKNDEFKRFEGIGIPPAKNGDYAFLLHMIKSLKSTGKAAVILPHGVLFRGNAEAEIRKNLIKRGYIKGIIGLPTNLFYGTGIPACIVVVDKENAEGRKGIFMIDASKGFMKDGNKNRLRERDIHKIVDVFTNQLEVPKYSRLVSVAEIANEKNDYNLNIPRYIDSQEDEDIQDIDAHLKGDIPNKDVNDLESYWKVYPSLRNVLFSVGKRERYSVIKVEQQKIKATIFEHPEFVNYTKKINTTFNAWKEKNIPVLKSIAVGAKPKELIFNISKGILSTFSKFDLIDKYDVYQHLMTYWADTMQDDVYIIAVDGWKIERNVIQNKKGKATGLDCDLLPKGIAIKKYFAAEQSALDDLQTELDSVSQQKESLEEENSGEEDLFEEARSDNDKISKKELVKRINFIQFNREFEDELKILKQYLQLIEKEAELKSKIKDAEEVLDKKLLAKYKSFTESEIKELVVHDKWIQYLHNAVNGELERISHKLAGRIKELAERYETPLPKLAKEVNELSLKVDKHLEKMGFRW